ncbi:uncharacterized [Tachysurus ichikawai]
MTHTTACGLRRTQDSDDAAVESTGWSVEECKHQRSDTEYWRQNGGAWRSEPSDGLTVVSLQAPRLELKISCRSIYNHSFCD